MNDADYDLSSLHFVHYDAELSAPPIQCDCAPPAPPYFQMPPPPSPAGAFPGCGGERIGGWLSDGYAWGNSCQSTGGLLEGGGEGAEEVGGQFGPQHGALPPAAVIFVCAAVMAVMLFVATVLLWRHKRKMQNFMPCKTSPPHGFGSHPHHQFMHHPQNNLGGGAPNGGILYEDLTNMRPRMILLPAGSNNTATILEKNHVMAGINHFGGGVGEKQTIGVLVPLDGKHMNLNPIELLDIKRVPNSYVMNGGTPAKGFVITDEALNRYHVIREEESLPIYEEIGRGGVHDQGEGDEEEEAEEYEKDCTDANIGDSSADGEQSSESDFAEDELSLVDYPKNDLNRDTHAAGFPKMSPKLRQYKRANHSSCSAASSLLGSTGGDLCRDFDSDATQPSRDNSLSEALIVPGTHGRARNAVVVRRCNSGGTDTPDNKNKKAKGRPEISAPLPPGNWVVYPNQNQRVKTVDNRRNNRTRNDSFNNKQLAYYADAILAGDVIRNDVVFNSRTLGASRYQPTGQAYGREFANHGAKAQRNQGQKPAVELNPFEGRGPRLSDSYYAEQTRNQGAGQAEFSTFRPRGGGGANERDSNSLDSGVGSSGGQVSLSTRKSSDSNRLSNSSSEKSSGNEENQLLLLDHPDPSPVAIEPRTNGRPRGSDKRRVKNGRTGGSGGAPRVATAGGGAYYQNRLS